MTQSSFLIPRKSAMRLIAALFLLTLPACAQLDVPLTIQEALYPGAKGVSRQNGSVTVGVPLPDSAAIKDVSQLGLKGASAGQFRVLGRWPSGNIRWVLVDTQANLAGGKSVTGISLVNGKGNFGGADLASDQGGKIVVNTGPAQFVIGKSGYNVFDQVTVGGKTLVKSGASEGLVIMGPDTTIKVPAPSSPASLSQTSGGSMPQRTYSVRISYATTAGETEATKPSTLAISAGSRVVVASPPGGANIVGYYVYVSRGGEPETLQTPKAIPIGQSWTEPSEP